MNITINSCRGELIKFENIEGMLFDLDGTLVDTLNLHILAFKDILKEYDIKIKDGELEKLMGRTPQDIFRIYLPELSDSELWQLSIRKEEYLYSLVESPSEIIVNQGVRSLLHELGEKNIKRVVISSSHRSLVNRLLSNVNLTEFFETMVCGDDVKKGKPDPEPFSKGADRTGLSSAKIIAIGDSIYDFLSASSAGLHFIGITTGKTSCEKFYNNNCNSVINSFFDIRLN